MAIRVTGMYSGLDTESIISELVSAKSVKKQSLVKGQIKLSWKQDAWKALNTKIYNFYTNTLSNMRYQSSYMKKTTKVSNSSAITIQTSDNAVDGTRTVKVNQLAKNATLTGGSLETKSGVRFRGGADLATLRKYSGLDASDTLSGKFRVVGEQGQSIEFEVNENTTINDVVDMIKSTGLNCNYDEDSQRIFISSKNTGAANNFHIIADDEGGMNALAVLGLLSADDIKNNPELQKWADYDKAANKDAYDKEVADEVKAREKALKSANDKLTSQNGKLNDKNTELAAANKAFFDAMDAGDYLSDAFNAKYGEDLKSYTEKLYGDGGTYDELQAKKAALEAAKSSETATQQDIDDAQAEYDAVKADYDAASQKITDFLNDVAYGELVQKEDENGPVEDEDGNPVMVRKGDGLEAQYKEAAAAGGDISEIQGKVDSLNKWYDAVTSLADNKKAITSNEDQIAANTKQKAANQEYLDDTSKIKDEVEADFQARIKSAQDSLDAVSGTGKYADMLNGSKVNAQDAEIEIDGAKFTSLNNNFSVNGLTITANEVTDKEITITTANDTDGIYDMIKNFFTEYNSLINEMASLYNAESSSGYEPLTSEEKEALSESEIEEWEKKIKDSLLRRDGTLSDVMSSMTSILLQGVNINGTQLYLSDFGINTLGYFEADANERNAYHIDGDADDSYTKGNEDMLKKLISANPEGVMNFFTQLSTNLYDNLTNKMASTTMSSAFTVYNDKQMKDEYNDYADKIAKEEEKLNDLMDKWYAKFSKMEVALSKLESRSSSLASILGG